MAPSWQRENSISPPEYEPAMPRALTICLSFKPSSRPAATAAPNVPVKPGRVKTSSLQGISRGDTDARHHLAAGDERGKQRFAVGPLFFRHREGGQKCRCARMNAGAGLADIVELKGMGHGAVGERRLRRLAPSISPENGRAACAPESRTNSTDGPAPRLGRAVQRDRQSI